MSSNQIKYERFDTSPQTSLADSFVSTPGSNYPPIFDDSPREHPLDRDSPCSFDGYDESIMTEESPAPEPEKKPAVKKRKSWGQQLPEPKTHLPPRKRAKTEDEKEQRRVERVLRNRRAAQTSRERKRLEVEALEKQKQLVEQRLRDMEAILHRSEMERQATEAENIRLRQELANRTGGDMSVSSRTSTSSTYDSSPEPLRSFNPRTVTFSKELFGSRDSCGSNMSSSSMHNLHSSPLTSPQTVNPARLSPQMHPVDQSNASSSDMTQHPAVMLCGLQCQSEVQQPWMVSSGSNTVRLTLLALFLSVVTTLSTTMSPIIMVLHSLKTGRALSPSTAILSTIIWLATATSTSMSTLTSTSPTTSTRGQGPKFGLRIRLLRRLIASSPQLARPLLDATLGSMRLVSKQQIVPDSLNEDPANADSRRAGQLARLFRLMTMAHSIKVIMKEQKHHGRIHSDNLETRVIRRGGDQFSEVLGRYGLSFLSGIGDFGRRDLQKSLAEDKRRSGVRDWD